MDFKTFESLANNVIKPEHIREPQGLLNRTASVKVYDKIGIGYSKNDERGVFCTGYIKKDELFEEAPIIIVNRNDIKDSLLMDYVFKINANDYAVAFGCASLYNHRNQPSAYYKVDAEKKKISFYALRDIEPGEEIFVSYGKAYWNSRDISAKVSPSINKTK